VCIAGPWPRPETHAPSVALRHGTACAAVLFRQRTSSARVLPEKRTSARIAVWSSRPHSMRSFQLLECACCTHRLRFAVVRAERMCIAGPCSHPRLTSSLRICGSTTSRRSVSLPTTSSSDTTCTVSRLPHRVLWLRCARSYWQAVTPGTFAPASGSRGEKRGEDYRYQKGEMVNYWQAETTGSFAPALRKQRGEGLRGLLACQGLEDPTTRTSAPAGGSRGEKGGEDYWYRTRSSVNYWQASNSWHFCSKQFVRLLIYHRQSSA